MTRKNYLFAGSDSGGIRAAAMYTLIESAKMSQLDPEACLRDVLARIADHPINRIGDLLSRNWKPAGTRHQPGKQCRRHHGRSLFCQSMSNLLTLDDDVVGAVG